MDRTHDYNELAHDYDGLVKRNLAKGTSLSTHDYDEIVKRNLAKGTSLYTLDYIEKKIAHHEYLEWELKMEYVDNSFSNEAQQTHIRARKKWIERWECYMQEEYLYNHNGHRLWCLNREESLFF